MEEELGVPQKLQESQKLQLEAESRLQLSETVRSVLQAGHDVAAVGSAVLEGALRLLTFERGFLFAKPLEAPPTDESLDLGDLAALASLTVTSDGHGWSAVRNPELAVNRSVLQRALVSGQRIVLNDSLQERDSEDKARHRAVVCEPFEIRPGVQGLLYLDRTMGRGDVSQAELSQLQHCVEACLPSVARAYLVGEIKELQQDSTAVPGESGVVSVEAPEDSAPTREISSYHGVIGTDEALKKVTDIVEKIKDSELNVCIVGESGTGKELLARAIHQASRRRDAKFVGENCGSIPENLLESELFGHVKGAFTGAEEDRQGLFETADQGVLFLDEIGDMSEGMQRKLLRVLEEKSVRPVGGKTTVKVDVRVLCASNRDLKQLVQKKLFRADLYYRLNVVTLELPPLRERIGDLPLLVEHFLNELAREEGAHKRLSESAMKALLDYSWPGNVRELRNLLRRVLLTCPTRVVARKDVVGLLSPVGTAPYVGEDLERDDRQIVLRLPARQSFHEIIDECERIVLLNALRECAWNKSKVTQTLKIPRQSLYNKIAKYDLRRDWPDGATPPKA